jgi:polyhydroxybutyrate depolymerase
LYVPATYAPGDRLPLVFALHGFTQTGQAIMNYSGFNALAESEKFIAVYPNGVNNGWNTNSGFPGGSTADDVGFISALIDTMIVQYGIDDQRVYSCGFSAGGFMSHRLACELDQRIAAIAAVAGTMSETAFNACSPAEKTPVMQVHGTSDFIVAYNGSAANVSVEATLERWNGANGCPVTPAQVIPLPDTVSDGSSVERIEYLPCDEDVEVVLLKVTGGGHTWPGAIGNSGIGTTNRDISASREIWDFFRRFTLTPATSVTPPPLTDAIEFFPNPVSDRLTLRTSNPAATGLDYMLLDTAGRTVLAGTFTGTSVSVDVSGLVPGLYVLVIGGRQQGAVRVVKR